MTARISQLAVCAIVSGTGAAVRRATTLLDGHAPHVLLATVRDRGRGDPTAFLFSDANAADFPESADAHVIALAVPKARLGRSRLAPVTELDDTPLLRAGQALLKSLAADLAHGDVLGVPEFDDLLVSLVRGVVQRHPVTDQRAAADAVMRQRLTDLIEARQEEDYSSTWPVSGETARAELADAGSGTIFLDGIISGDTDPLWDEIVQAVRSGTRVVLTTPDIPDPELLSGLDAQVLDERDLRFTSEEIDALATTAGLPLAAEVRDELAGRLRGVPFLVYEQLDRLQKRRQERIWAGPAFTFDRTLYDHVRAHTDAADASAFVALLRMAAGTRRFSLRLLSHPTAVPPELALQFDRLESIPLGDFDIDDETGERDFVWSSMTWHTLEADRTPAERLVQGELALARARADGRVTGQLYPLLQLGRLDEADALVFDQHRRFLVFTNAETQEALLGSKELAGHPSLLLLTAELRLRRLGANPQTIRDGASCLVAFAPPPDADALLRFRLLCRRSMAATYAGRRAEATRHLTRLSAMLDDVEDTRLRSAAHADPAIASRVAGDLFLAFWSAVQTDHHDLALGLADTMSEYGRPDDPLTQIDQLTAITEEDFAGKRSRDPSGERPPLLEFSHAAAIVLLEEGADAEAIEHSRALAPRVRPAPTRSAVDALILLSRSLGSAEPIDGSLIDATVALSSAFWDDGQPSSFIAFAAVVAHLRAGRVSEARRIMRTASDTGWFVPTAHALIALQEDSPETALPLLEASATRTSLPRLRVISGVLSAAALAQRGLPEAAAARLAAEWRESPAPRLFRFALRFLDSDSFESLSRASRGVDLLDLGEVLVASASDPRPRGADPVLSPTEREILALLGRGLSNAEIAEARSVSPNTVRTQLRMLYRKLGAANRSEAVAATTRLVPLDASSGEIG